VGFWCFGLSEGGGGGTLDFGLVALFVFADDEEGELANVNVLIINVVGYRTDMGLP
jgi:hypothetical protein